MHDKARLKNAKVPIVVNVKPITEGEEIVIYKVALKKEAPPMKPVLANVGNMCESVIESTNKKRKL